MSAVILRDYTQSDVRYELDETLTLRRYAGAAPYVGVAQTKTFGLVERQKMNVAVFVDDSGELRFSVGSLTVSLEDRRVRIGRTAPAPFVRTLTVTDTHGTTHAWAYWHFGWREWPHDGDLVGYAAGITSSLETRAGFSALWKMRREGLPVESPEGQAELERRTAQILESFSS